MTINPSNRELDLEFSSEYEPAIELLKTRCRLKEAKLRNCQAQLAASQAALDASRWMGPDRHGDSLKAQEDVDRARRDVKKAVDDVIKARDAVIEARQAELVYLNIRLLRLRRS